MRRTGAAMVLILAACSAKKDPPPPPTELVATGTVALTANDAIALEGAASCDVGGTMTPIADLVIQATGMTDRCALVSAGEERGGARVITLEVFRTGGVDPELIGTGTYAITTGDPYVNPDTGASDLVSADVTLIDPECNATGAVSVAAVGGSFTVDAVTTTSVHGTADIQLDGGATLKGRFDAAPCATSADVCTSLVPLNPVCL